MKLFLAVAAACLLGVTQAVPFYGGVTVNTNHRRFSGRGSSSRVQFGPTVVGGRGGPPLALLGGIANSISNALNRLKEGSKELIGNAKELGPLRKRFNSGEPMSFHEYNLMQRTSADIAKTVGLIIFTISKPEFAPFICSFFPQVVPSTFLTPDEKLARSRQKNFQRVKAVVSHIMNLQTEAVTPGRKETDNMKHLKTLEGILKAQNKGFDSSLREIDGALFTPEKPAHIKGRIRADLHSIPRPFLVSVANSVGMWNRFVPAFGLRAMLSDYLYKIRESDSVLFKTNLDKLPREDLLDACSQRAISIGTSDTNMRANLKSYLKTVSRPPVSSSPPPPASSSSSTAAAGPLVLNEFNLRFALLGLNMANLIREANENSGLRALFGKQ